MRHLLPCIYILCLLAFAIFASGKRFVVFIDAGSTGSRISVFESMSTQGLDSAGALKVVFQDKTMQNSLDEYRRSRANCTSLCRGLFSSQGNSLRPSFSTIGLETDDLSHYISILLFHIESLVPDRALAVVHLAATGTIQTDPLRSQKLNATRRCIQSLGWKTGAVRITKPKEEAMFGWLGANIKSLPLGATHPYVDLGFSDLRMAIESDRACDTCLTIKIDGIPKHVRVWTVVGTGVSKTYNKRKWTECQGSTYQDCLSATRIHAKDILIPIKGVSTKARLIATGGFHGILEKTLGSNARYFADTNHSKADNICRRNLTDHNMLLCFSLAWSQTVLESVTSLMGNGPIDSVEILNSNPFPLGAVLHANNSKKSTPAGIIGSSVIILVVCGTFLGFIIMLVITVLLIYCKRRHKK